MKITLGFKFTYKDWLKLIVIPLLLCILVVFLINLTPKYETTATIYPIVESVGNLDRSALRKMERSARRLIWSMNQQKQKKRITTTHEKLAQLQSVQLTKQFIIKYDLKKLLFEDKWDSENLRWRDTNNKGEPSLAKAVKSLNQRFKINYDKNNNVITIKFTWKSPVIAAQIVNDYINFADNYIADELERIKLDELNRLQRLNNEIRYVSIQQDLIAQYESMLTSMNSESGPSARQFKVLSLAYIAEEPIFKLSPFLIVLVLLLSVFLVFLFIVVSKKPNKKLENTASNII
ncbi:hypothetical protein EKO29_06625 [Colwellia sp. Arc7-635]|uniref:hypothetical protein n=1 Tax=Colwellia sp. Arc7-635 TaxID=2497879 RepID=UPI000F855728|nr:hypothetical protein [Colwellia sp. Arc7-635]AZQ83733.1 hypothetical protein EKO29_06625 [Colwellia sp. Arc7-635]